jgi:1,4-dihydroxy-6-naphthoate synthase
MPGERSLLKTGTRQLSLGFSPCPNDTFIFHALVKGIVDAHGLSFHEKLLDVETLNRLALDTALDVTKVSFHLFGHIRREYTLLSAGAALGRGCGPLLVAGRSVSIQELRGLPVALPGRYTTAALLLRLYDHGLDNLVYMPFDRIMPAVATGEVAAGLIIHESRFTFSNYGLVKLVDLGDWWESDSGCPLPLGGIVARTSLGPGIISAIDTALRSSIEYAFANPAASRDYIRTHAQELSDEVCAAHINLYVNDYSRDLGDDGMRAVNLLLARGEAAGLIPRS